MSRTEQKDLRRRQILDLSLDLFVRNGYWGTTTKEIADRLNISQGLLFHYFESKDALYIEHLKQAATGMEFSSLQDNPQFSLLTPIKIIKIMSQYIFQSFHNSESAKLLMLVAQAQICTKLPGNIKELAANISQTKMMIQLIEQGQQLGEIRKGSAEALTGCWFSAIQGIAQTYVCYPFVPLPEADWLIDMLRA